MPVYHSAVCGFLIDGSTVTQQPASHTTPLPCAEGIFGWHPNSPPLQVAQHIDLGISQTADVH